MDHDTMDNGQWTLMDLMDLYNHMVDRARVGGVGGLLISSAYISYVGKHACELGLISGTPNGYQLKVEIPV